MTPNFVPPFLGQDVMSNAEKKIFETLHSLDFSNSYVFHSVGLPFHEKKIYGETDFLLVCPRGVLVLEVKGGRVACVNGRWSYMNRRGQVNKNESPFNQAKDNMFSVMRHISKKFENNSELHKKIPFGYGVMFPDIRYEGNGIEDPQALVYDSFSNIRSYVNDVFDYWDSRPNAIAGRLSDSQIDAIAKSIRRDFNYIPSISSSIEHSERSLVNLTREQSAIIDSLSENDRLVIKGGAGTGKTLLAAYYANKRADEGKKVLCLTYNKNLAKAVKHHNKNENIKTINVHALFGEFVKTDERRIRENPEAYFSEELPNEFCRHIDSLSQAERENALYDVVVMDEAQDFLRSEILASLDRVLKGGLSQGCWAVFYDASQNIYNSEFEKGFALLDTYGGMKFTLTTNCRNTARIARYCSEKTNIGLDTVLRAEGGEVSEVAYSDDEGFKSSVAKIISDLRKGRVAMGDIVFLSPRSYKNSLFAKAEIQLNELGDNFVENGDLPLYSSLQGYKGLDSKVVVLAGLEEVAPENFPKYFYIAGTRAREVLYVLVRK